MTHKNGHRPPGKPRRARRARAGVAAWKAAWTEALKAAWQAALFAVAPLILAGGLTGFDAGASMARDGQEPAPVAPAARTGGTTAEQAGDRAVIVSGPGEVTELWSGKVLTATFRAGMCFSADGRARGVLLLRHANGQEDVYHLKGTIRSNSFDLAHSSGHVFAGRLTGPHSMEGRVTLKNGLRLSLEGTRALDVPLAAEDCAPLPQ